MLKRRIVFLFFVATMIAAMLSGCSSPKNSAATTDSNASNNESAQKSTASTKPINLTLLQTSGGGYTQDELNKLVLAPVQKKYPNITIDFILNKDPKALIAAGQVPDLVLIPDEFIKVYTTLGYALDLNGLIKQHKGDIGKFDPIAIDNIKAFGDKGQLYALPFAETFSALFYNKDVFDKFGVAYPKDGMNWDDVMELGNKVARTDNSVVYRPILPMEARELGSQLSLPFVDPATNKAAVNSDGWKKVFETYNAALHLPGNSDPSGGPAQFVKDQNIAMLANYSGTLTYIEDAESKGIHLNWDMVTYPSFKEAPGKSLSLEDHVLMISATTNYKEDAYNILDLLTNDENQLANSRAGRLSVLKDPKMRASFGEDLDFLKGKNMQGVFKSTPAKIAPPTIYWTDIRKIVNDAAKKSAKGSVDINTALQEAEDAANKVIVEGGK